MKNTKTSKSNEGPSEKTKWKVKTTLAILTVVVAAIAIVVAIILHPWTPPDFAISASPMQGMADPASSIPFTIRLKCFNGYQEDVLLTSSGEPSGVVVTFDGSTINSKRAIATVTATIASDVPANTYEITFKGKGNDGTEHNLVYTLTVKPTPTPTDHLADFSISVSPSNGTVLENGATETTVKVTSANGYGQDILLSVSGQTSGIDFSFNPSQINPKQNSQSTLTLRAASDTPVGDYRLTIVGTGSDGVKHDATFTLTVTQVLPTVKISSPKGGDGVNTSITVEGTAQNVPSDQTLWVFVRGSDRYYPMTAPATITVTGTWSSPAYVGGDNDTGKPFTLCAVPS